MDPFVLLFLLALLWLIVATVQDVRTTEIADWLTFSLIGVGFSYRLVYALVTQNQSFFWWGFLGFVFFTSLSYLFYYAHLFAGGDAKLLAGLGLFIPASSYSDLLLYGFGFIVLFLLSGVVWSLAYTFYRVVRQPTRFLSGLRKELKGHRMLIGFLVALSVVIFTLFAFVDYMIGLFFGLAILFSGFLFMYVRVFERTYLIRTKSPKELMLGDWIVSAVKVRNFWIKPSVHGLNEKEILLLRKYNKSVVVRDGVVFGPGFLIGFILFLLFYFDVLNLPFI